MEEAFTRYLKSINALLEPICVETDVKKGNFEYEASVIIPVRNRARTIDDAIRSALTQETRFPFNIIVVDNHSTDGTTEIIGQYKDNKAVIHLQPQRTDLGIGDAGTSQSTTPGADASPYSLTAMTCTATPIPCKPS